MTAVGRIAPTPSGYLHLGNAVNFLLTVWLLRTLGGQLILRIDDYDSARVRPEYVDDIFRTLDWLGIYPDAGPSGPDDFARHYALPHRIQRYRDALNQARVAGATLYPCVCSRRDMLGHAGAGCARDCAAAGLELRTGRTALRLVLPGPRMRTVDGCPVDLQSEFGDPIVWMRDGDPGFVFASVVDDRDLGVDVVVRGRDLIPSTAAQLAIAPLLGATTFAAARFVHHGLLAGPDGAKLSKSAGRRAASHLRDTPGGLSAVVDAAAAVGRAVGIAPA